MIATPRQIIRQIVEEVAQRYGVSAADVMSDSRRKAPSRARQEAQAALYEIRYEDGTRRFSLPMIGRAFGRDHTSVLNSVRRVRERAEADQ